MFARVKASVWIDRRLPGDVRRHDEAAGTSVLISNAWAHRGQLLEMTPEAYRHLQSHCERTAAPPPRSQPPQDEPQPKPSDAPLPPPRTTIAPAPVTRGGAAKTPKAPKAPKTPKARR